MDHRIREAVESFTARVRRDLDAHVQGLTTDLLRVASENQEYWRSTLERAVTDARQDAERGFKARLEAIRNELQRETDVRLSTERAALKAATDAATLAAANAAQAMKAGTAPGTMGATAARNARVDTLERLLGAVRRIDDSDSLTGILEALSEGAAAETSRIAILLADGEMLRPWNSVGFAPGQEPGDLPIGTSGVLAASVVLKQTSFVQPIISNRDSELPGFMRVPIGHTGLIVPLVVGGDVVAVLYADDVGKTEEHEDAPVWTEEIDLLVRHAAIRLENVTSVRTAEVLGS
jgi:hypothetical protein